MEWLCSPENRKHNMPQQGSCYRNTVWLIILLDWPCLHQFGTKFRIISEMSTVNFPMLNFHRVILNLVGDSQNMSTRNTRAFIILAITLQKLLRIFFLQGDAVNILVNRKHYAQLQLIILKPWLCVLVEVPYNPCIRGNPRKTFISARVIHVVQLIDTISIEVLFVCQFWCNDSILLFPLRTLVDFLWSFICWFCYH